MMYSLLVYGIGCVLAFWLIAYYATKASTRGGTGVDVEDVLEGLLLGLALCWFWPLVVPGWLIYQALKEED